MKTFQRSKTNVMIAGVCGGLGEYFNIDPLLFRIIFVIAALSGSLGIWIYLLLWLFSKPTDSNRPDASNHDFTYRGKESARDKACNGNYRKSHHAGNNTVEDVDFTYVDDINEESAKDKANINNYRKNHRAGKGTVKGVNSSYVDEKIDEDEDMEKLFD